MSGLKPCPFCGGDTLKTGFLKEFILIEYVQCECGCEMPLSEWNRRPAENRIKAQGIREAVSYLERQDVAGAPALILNDDLIEYANKLQGQD